MVVISQTAARAQARLISCRAVTIRERASRIRPMKRWPADGPYVQVLSAANHPQVNHAIKVANLIEQFWLGHTLDIDDVVGDITDTLVE